MKSRGKAQKMNGNYMYYIYFIGFPQVLKNLCVSHAGLLLISTSYTTSYMIIIRGPQWKRGKK